MPSLKIQTSDGKFLTIPVDPKIDPSQYDGIVEDALQHYNGSLQQPQSNGPKPQTMANGQPYIGPKEEGSSPYNDLTSDVVQGALGVIPAIGAYAQKNINATQDILGKAGVPSNLSAAALTPAGTLASIMNPETPTEKMGSGALGLISLAGGPEGISNAYDAAIGGIAKAVGGPAGQLVGALTRVNPRLATYAINNPEVLNGPEIADVSKKMGDYFSKRGYDVNNETVQQLFKKNYFPSEGQVSDLQNKFIDPIIAKGNNATEQELVLAERAANAMTRSTQAQSNRSMMAYAIDAKNQLQQAMNDRGMTELGDLKKEYMGALAKDAFSDILPQNKQGSANALSTLVLSKKIKDAIGSLASGKPMEAVANLAQAGAMSPLVVGKGIQAISNPEFGGPNLAAEFGSLPTLSKLPSNLSNIMSDERGAINPGGINQKLPDAKFIGVQKVPGEEGLPLFNVTQPGHELEGSTVTADTLVKNNLYPEFEDITKQVKSMLQEGKSESEIEKVIQDTQSAHSAFAQASRQAWIKALNKR